MKKIGIIGSGAVARTLGAGFIKHGYQVKLGSRDTGKLSEWQSKAGPNASVGSFEEAAAFGDLLVLAVKGGAAKDVVQQAGIENLKGKTVIDTSNPVSGPPSAEGILPFFTTLDSSLMEQLQKEAPEVHFVKAFNTIGSAAMVNPEYKEGKPSMFICGNEDKAKSEVKEILELFGFEVEDMGKAEAARAIEPLSILWCIPGFRQNQWTHAFKLLKK
jgi:predicted dinucleotide-binding enzyme